MQAGCSYIEADHFHLSKHGNLVAGDVFLCRKIKEEGRIVAVLSDGLGSGIKANVLASITATMASKYAAGLADIRRSAEIILRTLPVCSVRKISYATFTIVDIGSEGKTRLIEYDNPACLLFRDGRSLTLPRDVVRLEDARRGSLHSTEFQARPGDRMVFFSDGVSQAGMGLSGTPIGWGQDSIEQFVAETIEEEPAISARELARVLVDRAAEIDGGYPKDDITCGVIYFREPRRLLVATGPPFSMARDRELAMMVSSFPGRKAIAGGTTANIVARQLHRRIEMKLEEVDSGIPPAACMDGVDLIAEGTLTLGRVAAILEQGAPPESMRPNPATRLACLLLESDIVQFVVGTRINQAHQDPNIPVELDLRRNIVRRITHALETKYMKETQVQYL